MSVLQSLITAFPVSRADYIKLAISHSFHIASHLVKAVEFREGKHNTREWLKQTENALRAMFNTPTEKRLKADVFNTIYKKLSINDDNTRLILKGEITAWLTKNKSLLLSKTTTRDIALAVNNIIAEQCKLACEYRVRLHTEVPEGVLTDSSYAWSQIEGYEALETRLLLKSAYNEVESLLRQIESTGVVD